VSLAGSAVAERDDVLAAGDVLRAGQLQHQGLVERGEDAPYRTQRSNVELVDAAVNAIQKAGSEPATTAEVRAELAAYKMPAN
jgi:uncharacterized protein (DUF849 family)